jgi:hypothetical protein
MRSHTDGLMVHGLAAEGKFHGAECCTAPNRGRFRGMEESRPGRRWWGLD